MSNGVLDNVLQTAVTRCNWYRSRSCSVALRRLRDELLGDRVAVSFNDSGLYKPTDEVYFTAFMYLCICLFNQKFVVHITHYTSTKIH